MRGLAALCWLALLAGLPLAGQGTFERLERDLKQAGLELGISDLRAVVIESGRVVWRNGVIKENALEEPVVAERMLRLAQRGKVSLDDPAPVPPGATIRQVLANMADGTPGEEVLDNRSFFDALRPIVGNAPPPDAVRFATEEHEPLGWFSQDYAGQRIFWSYEPTLVVVRIPNQKRALVVWANSDALTKAARLEDGNVVRSTVVLAWLGESERDQLIDRSLVALYRGQKEEAAALAHRALDKFPELESTSDVALLYLFAQLRLPETQGSATVVIRDHPTLPTAWFYYGMYLENSKRNKEAAACFEKITMHEPPWHNWTVAAAKKELSYIKTY
jgi:hypothetical protein